MKKVAFHTLGCKLNFAETSTMARSLTDHGYEQVGFGEKADVYVINSCSVTSKADKKSEQALKKARKMNPSARVIMVGCYAQLQPDKIAGNTTADLVLGNTGKSRLIDHLEKPDGNKDIESHGCTRDPSGDFFPAFSFGDRTRSFLKVQDGCDYGCSYCTIPLARGRSRNQPIDEITREASEIAQKGVKEIILTGVNVGDFGKSTGESFQGLIRALEEVPGIERYRISSIEPNLLSRPVIDHVASSEKFLPHFHIPLQSGCDKILGRMRRRYRRDTFREKIETIRQVIPDAFIGVDLIVGFPGEDEEKFDHTFAFLREMDVSYYHAFSFSRRPGTKAYAMDQQVPGNVIRDRSLQVQQLAEEKKKSFYARHTGQTRPVLFENPDEQGKAFGFTDNYIRVETPGNAEELQGRICQVELINLNDQGNMTGRITDY